MRRTVAGPGVQVEPNTATALKTASEANDHVAAQIARLEGDTATSLVHLGAAGAKDGHQAERAS